MNVIHAFMLILAIAGRPEKAIAICDTYKKCSDEGAVVAQLYEKQLGSPREFSYRIIPVIIMPEAPTT